MKHMKQVACETTARGKEIVQLCIDLPEDGMVVSRDALMLG